MGVGIAATHDHLHWTDALSAREWATLIWAVAAVIVIAFFRDLRQSMVTIVAIWRSPILFVPVSFMLAYVATVVFGASQIDLWNTHMIGATTAWTITVALVGFFRVNRVSGPLRRRPRVASLRADSGDRRSSASQAGVQQVYELAASVTSIRIREGRVPDAGFCGHID